MTSSSASRTSNPASAEARGEHAGDARLPLDPSAAATPFKNTSGQQNNQTQSSEDNLQQQEGGSDNPLSVANSESPEGIWLNQAELIQAQDKIGSLTSNAAAAVELLNQVANENEGLRLHVALLEKRAKDPDTRSMIGADLHHGGQPEPGDVLYGQNARTACPRSRGTTAGPR